MKTQKTEKIKYLFSNVNQGNYSGKWDKNDVNRKFRYWSKKVNRRIYAHLFRKSFCSNSIHSGMPIAVVSNLMGHYGNEAIRTTLNNYYCPMSDDDAKKVYVQFSRKFTIGSKANIKKLEIKI